MAVALSVNALRGTYVSPICTTTRAIPNVMTADYSLETPLPLNSTGCAPPPSCCTLTDAVRKPVAVGLNLTSMAQLELAGTLEPQVVVSTKSPKLFPTIPIPRMLNGVLPVLVNVTLCGGLKVPTLWSGKSRLVGDNLTTVPVPVS